MNVMLDSGAFSADSQNKPIILRDYMNFIHKHEQDLEVYVCLDVIGNAEKTWENQKIMESEGLTPLPVFHSEDHIRYLYKCLEYEYFALGGMAGKGASSLARIRFLDMCWNIICDNDGYPKHKVHGFGMTSMDLLFRYPWFSTDSTSWVQLGRYGMILVPRVQQGRYRFDKSPITVKLSSRSPALEKADKHLETMAAGDRERLIEYIETKGFSLGESRFENGKGVVVSRGLSNDGVLRDNWNMLYFLNIERILTELEPRCFCQKSGACLLDMM